MVTGGSGADTVYANAGADTLDGGGGDDQLSGGSDKVDGLADGDVALYRGIRAEYTIQVSGNTLVVTDGVAERDGTDSLLNIETLRFADGDLLMGSAGDDILDYDPGLAPDVDGGAGTDTLRITGSGSALDLTQIADDEIIGIERFDLTGTGDNDLTLALTDLLSLSDTSNTLTVLGDAGDSVSTTDSGWTSAGTVNVGGALFDSYAQGLASLLVDQDVDQTGILA